MINITKDYRVNSCKQVNANKQGEKNTNWLDKVYKWTLNKRQNTIENIMYQRRIMGKKKLIEGNKNIKHFMKETKVETKKAYDKTKP